MGKYTNKVTAAGLIITLGIIYGDIGTSPLYVLNEIIAGKVINEQLILGSLSCIIWTLTLQTTVKYVILTLKADNKGEGGVFSLYALVRRRKKWLVIPAMMGGAALLADGIITSPISVSSAVEGLKQLPKLGIQEGSSTIVLIVISIITLLFVAQQFGTASIGKLFGPIMSIWFIMLAMLGILHLHEDMSIFKALSPHYAIDLLTKYPKGFWLLGSVFLCTTGAEALYSDLGHCGRDNIRISWGFVKVCLILNYLGQGAWLLANKNGAVIGDEQFAQGFHTFFELMPQWFKLIGVIIATVAAIIASQALISGAFTLIGEAIKLNLWPKLKVVYPTEEKGQLYIPGINWLLYVGCVGVTLFFQKSTNMGAAYGLAITMAMISTSVLFANYLVSHRVKPIFIYLYLLVYITIESSFLIANLDKFPHGGFVTLIIGGGLFIVMYIWYRSRKIKNRYIEFVRLHQYIPLLKELSEDNSIAKYATHLVYMTSANNPKEIEHKIIYSILNRKPKRADIYWFVHVDVIDEPYTCEYSVDHIMANDIIRVEFRLGFRVEQRINMLFRKVVQDLVMNKEVDITSRYESLEKNNVAGDFQFVVMEKYLSSDNELPFIEKLIMKSYFWLKEVSLGEERGFGLDPSTVTVEKFPLIVSPVSNINLKRLS
ncbi:MAG: KUP/HAK/KT family potassium transporter [Bacteroidetes bacterium]|nr:KUP/HAK/KT family potassium transporter [Bacteroidota bacterium]MBS1591323.1 KUP/HAK/KT family potassium transporter [Bacteroidota bacterium]MBS1640741.1 KUP/HAK/KT family potassium transporter [Bacteroidota bacterium]MBS1642377.1 KUP/HAK/KT family potassium transporter [Bacteroidota bacterium]MBS1671622.1 KUP/HAK/KT family potassium transporter [Bacteroidota bacterium]